MGDALVGHDRLDVREVEVDESVFGDEARDAFDAVLQHVVRHLEGVEHAGVDFGDLQQSVVRNDDQGIDVVLQELDAELGVFFSLASFEGERLGDHAYGKRAHGLRSLRDDRRSAGTGAAAHAGGDEHHVAACDDLLERFQALFRGLLTHFGIAARAQALRQFFADLDLRLGSVIVESLAIRVDRDERDALQVGLDHSVYGVAACAAYAYDFNICRRFGRRLKL